MTARRPRVLVTSPIWPHVEGCIQAAEVAPFEIARCLQSFEDCDVVYACVGFDVAEPTAAARAGIEQLKAVGVRFLPPVNVPRPRDPGSLARWTRMLFARDPAFLLPGHGSHQPLVDALAAFDGGWMPDVVIPVWSYEATAISAGLPCAMYAFYGNPESKVYEANLNLDWRWNRRMLPRWLIGHLADRLRVLAIESASLKQMRQFALIAENAANDTEYYQAKGVPGIHYLPNMWPNPASNAWVARRDALEQTAPVKIAGNIGHLSATANTFGLWAISDEILPALKRRLGPDGFEMHIYGRLQPRPFLRRRLEDPAIRMRGFIDDIDAELLSCPVFLLANNRYGFKVGHTRILHAFSLGACVVAFRDTALAMPELVHGENILLGDDGDQIAELIAMAGTDHALRRRIGQAGADTLRRCFRPEDRVHEMGARIHTLVAGKATSHEVAP